MITENLSTLKIHKLTQDQYDRELAAGNIDANALYLTPDKTTNIEVDTTLTQSGMAADAKAVGDAISAPKTELTLISSTEGSTKKFKITIDDDGILTATEIVESTV